MRRIYFVILPLLLFNTISTEASDRLPLPDGWILIGCVGGSFYTFDSIPPKDSVKRFVRILSSKYDVCCMEEVSSIGFECRLAGEEDYTTLRTFTSQGVEIDAIRISQPKDKRRILEAHRSSSGRMVAVVLDSLPTYNGSSIGNTGYRQGFTQEATTTTSVLRRAPSGVKSELYVVERDSIENLEYVRGVGREIDGRSVVWELQRDALVYSDVDQRIVELDPADGSLKILCEGDSPSRIPGTEKILFSDRKGHPNVLDLQNSELRRVEIPSNVIVLGIQDFIPLPNETGYFIIAGSPFGVGGEWGFYDNSVSYWFLSNAGKASRLGGGRRLMNEYCFCLKQ